MKTRTLKEQVSLEGAGIHSGLSCTVRFHPEEPGRGIGLIRKGSARVPADWRHANADASDRRTVIIGPGGERFEQIEHLMAALAAEGITDATLEMEGPEVPFLGGGSLEYCEALRAAGSRETDGEAPVLEITRPVALQDGDALVVATPDSGLRLSCFVEFPGTVVGSQAISLTVTAETFLRAAGLIKGGNLQNAVVFDDTRYHNEGLHFPDEVVRHKVIDLLGDLALVGRSLRGHFWAWRAGHRSHVKFVQHLAREFQL